MRSRKICRPSGLPAAYSLLIYYVDDIVLTGSDVPEGTTSIDAFTRQVLQRVRENPIKESGELFRVLWPRAC